MSKMKCIKGALWLSLNRFPYCGHARSRVGLTSLLFSPLSCPIMMRCSSCLPTTTARTLISPCPAYCSNLNTCMKRNSLWTGRGRPWHPLPCRLRLILETPEEGTNLPSRPGPSHLWDFQPHVHVLYTCLKQTITIPNKGKRSLHRLYDVGKYY